jgi:hypothetical protein
LTEVPEKLTAFFIRAMAMVDITRRFRKATEARTAFIIRLHGTFQETSIFRFLFINNVPVIHKTGTEMHKCSVG